MKHYVSPPMTADEQLFVGWPVAHISAFRERQRIARKQAEGREAARRAMRRRWWAS